MAFYLIAAQLSNYEEVSTSKGVLDEKGIILAHSSNVTLSVRPLMKERGTDECNP